ncbi:MAG: hypothetical protein A3J71_00105 [Pseudomonadales bacterium RIFCSPHIGHO2_02_FULL_60_43]|nr:MAG: hypothetical protein A3J71_00105 [Pseudomonadales bacterium RIFCSPHIGHO2_02_FULL_60_43]
MDISIQKVMNQGTEQWSVCAGNITLYFRDQQSALEFSGRLKERVEAPHYLPLGESQGCGQTMHLECTS